MKTQPNDPINARPYSHDERPSGNCGGNWPETFEAFTGLTKREYFAAMAMQSYCMGGGNTIHIIDAAVRTADLLIEELNK